MFQIRKQPLFKPIQNALSKTIFPLIVNLTVRILSLNLPQLPINQLRHQVTNRCLHLQEDYLPPLIREEKELPLDYQQMIEKYLESGKPIKPVQHRKSIPQDLTCPDCGAPVEYIYSNSPVYSPSSKKKVQKYKCKICGRQWLLSSLRKHPSRFCPHCQRPIYLMKHRKEFDVYNCVNLNCPHKEKKGKRYIYKDYHLDLSILNRSSPTSPKIDLSRSHFSYTTIAIALTLLICFGLSSHKTVFFLHTFFSISITYQTLLNWMQSVAFLLYPLLNNLPLPLSNLWVVDEKYIRYEGKWGYLFTLLDCTYGCIVAQIFSPTRSAAGAYAVLHSAITRLKLLPSNLTIVSDGLTSYSLAIQLLKAEFNLLINHIKVIGLSDPKNQPKNEYRRYKNLIENFYSVLDPYIYVLRGFGSYQGAVAFTILFTVCYNYLRPNLRHNGCPPVKLDGVDFRNPILAWQQLFSLAVKRK